MRIEHSRKHGPFDPRYPPIRHKAAPAGLWRLGEECLDWQGFLARFYPGRRRHDFDALAAYESYRNDVERRADEEESPATADTDRWEGDGGALAARPRRRRRGERPVGAHKV